MPDWSYRPLLKPLLTRLPDRMAHLLTMSVLGFIGRHGISHRLIDLMGHMAAAPELTTQIGDATFCSPVAIGPDIDPAGECLGAFERFGAGALAVGPVDFTAPNNTWKAERTDGGLVASGTIAVDEVVANVRRWPRRRPVKLFCFLSSTAAADPKGLRHFLEQVGDDRVFAIVVPLPASTADLAGIRDICALFDVALWGSGSGEVPDLAETIEQLDGFVLAGFVSSKADSPERIYAPTRQPQTPPAAVTESALPWAAASGISDPGTANELFQAGASLLWVNYGLIESGPGLVKRINEMILADRLPVEVEPAVAESAVSESAVAESAVSEPAAVPAERQAWFWSLLLGISMLVGSVLTAFVGLTRVVLPYDEQISGVTLLQIREFNEKLLHFMAHDRLTLAGTMFSQGCLYAALAWYSHRLGHHWAQRTIIYSSLVGFLSFFSFFGYGYFDPFHAFVAAILFQFFIQVIVRQPSPRRERPVVRLHDDAIWLRFLWGQLLLVVQGLGLLLAGATITTFGATTVFVPQDLSFLGDTRDQILQHHPNLVALIAHDRATFGGMLLAAGVTILLIALWGLAPTKRWLWWLLLVAGFAPYLVTLWVHLRIGYVDHFHLAPVYIGMGLLLAALVLCRSVMVPKDFSGFSSSLKTMPAATGRIEH